MILDYARREVITARADDTAEDVAGLMDYYHVGAVVIVHQGRPVGIVTDRDLALCLLERRSDGRGDPRMRKVGDFMTRRLVTVREDEGFDRAVDLMSQAGVRRLPVVDSRGRLRGILTLDDVLEDISRDFRGVVRVLRAQARPEPRQDAASPADPEVRAG